MRSRKRFKCSILDLVFRGIKVILWPCWASLLERRMSGVMWPKANQGYIAMCKVEEGDDEYLSILAITSNFNFL